MKKLQVGRQSSLNELPVTVVLNLEQLTLPPEQYNSHDDPLLVIGRQQWAALKTRTEELKAERAMHKHKFKYTSSSTFATSN